MGFLPGEKMGDGEEMLDLWSTLVKIVYLQLDI
jgi:hypothetical protein